MVPAISLGFIQIIWKLANCFYNYRVSVKYPHQHHLRSSVLSPNDLQLRMFLILVILKTLAKFLDNWLKWSQIYEFFFLLSSLSFIIPSLLFIIQKLHFLIFKKSDIQYWKFSDNFGRTRSGNYRIWICLFYVSRYVVKHTDNFLKYMLKLNWGER